MNPEDDIKLPAIREAGALAEYCDTPGTELMGFLAFLRSELDKAIEILREETAEQLEDGDPFERIQVVNRLKLRKNRLEAHLIKELREVKDLARSLIGQTDKAVVNTINNECKSTLDSIRGGLQSLVQEFGCE